ncbi:MAG: glycosyltransferase [Patescibacteria group bacterium]|nr:glycosyltransferase [Patescibacteria group bacterium]
MNVALIHDHLAQDGGAEKVLKVFSELFPKATIYTLLYKEKQVDKYFKKHKIETSIIQKLPGGVSHYKWYMPFMPMAVEFFDLRKFDLVISDVSAFAKGVITDADTPHICYCHTPTRYLWDYTHQYINELNYNKYFKKVISLMLNYIRLWDRSAADRVDYYIANSKTVRKRIKKYYRRDSTVIYPPVDVERFDVKASLGDYYLVGGRLAPYKRIDIAIETFKELGLKLKVYGDGVDLPRLKKIAGNSPYIEFLGRVKDKELPGLYASCLAFLYPQEEDFGITAIEAMASGRPVIAYARGGARETVQAGINGEFFYEQSAQAIVRTLGNFNPKKYHSQRIKQMAGQYSIERFKKEIMEFIKIKKQAHKEEF